MAKKRKILIVIAIIIAIVAGIVGKNKKAMNSCIESALSEIKKQYTVTPVDVGEYEKMQVLGPFKFHVEQYAIEELGNLSIMRANMGIMQMATVVITPRDKNLPLLSTDYMYILSNRKCYLELYDLVKEKDTSYNQLLEAISKAQSAYEHLADMQPSEAWYEHLLTTTVYKSGSIKNDKELESLLADTVKTYVEQSKDFSVLSEAEKEEKQTITLEYTDGLIEKGGISTDVFKKALGEEETKKFFDTVFFGTTVN